ncbi:MAG: hypothetical protein II749_00860 [Clostridia bacterium]|nr:hypothetical protein [Clostridia bacterium]
MIFYKNYTYAPRATFISVLFSLLAFLLAVCGVMLFVQGINDKKYLECVFAVILAAGAVVSYIFGSVKLSKKIAQKDGVKNIYSKAKYALIFLRQHPEAYDDIVRKNQDFAAKYFRDETGKIVKKK